MIQGRSRYPGTRDISDKQFILPVHSYSKRLAKSCCDRFKCTIRGHTERPPLVGGHRPVSVRNSTLPRPRDDSLQLKLAAGPREVARRNHSETSVQVSLTIAGQSI